MNEIVPVENGAPAKRAPMMAGGRPQAIVPQSMEDCYRLATAVCEAGMAPKGLDTPAKAMVAMMHGLEVGLTPMAALQRIALVNGRPTIWGDGAVGLVRGSGLCVWIREDITGAGDAQTATCESQRKGEPEPIKRTFSVADAKKAGLWGKSGPWQQFPNRMLAMRARAFCLRDGFADVLGGLYLKEELDNGDEPAGQPQRRAPSPSTAPMIEQQAPAANSEPIQQAAPEPVQQPRRAPSPSAAPHTPAKPAEPAQRPASAAAVYDPEKVRKRLAEAFKAAKTQDDINEAWDTIIDPIQDGAFPSDRADWDQMVRLREAEIGGQEGAAP